MNAQEATRLSDHFDYEYVEDLRPGLFVRPLTLVRESPDNPRSISDERFADLKADLEHDPAMLNPRPLISLPNGDVVAGNMRLRSALDLGWDVAPVYVKDLDEAQILEWVTRDNQDYGDWVPDELAGLMAAHRDAGHDTSHLGFADTQVEALLKAHGAGEGGGTDQPRTDDPAPEVWGVIVDCPSEDAQAELITELADRDLEVRALIP